MVAVAIVGSAVVGAGASIMGANAQADATKNASAQQMAMYQQTRADQAPYRQTGTSALNMLGGYVGLPGYSADNPSSWNYKGQSFGSQDEIRGALEQDYRRITSLPEATAVPQGVKDEIERNVRMATPESGGGAGAGGSNLTGSLLHQFNANDLNDTLAPNYAFMRDQGIGATRNALNARGGDISGNTLRGVTQFAQDYAGNAYQQAFSNYTANQTNIFNRLSDIAGLGQTANQAVGAAGTTAAGNTGVALTNAGAATAGGTVGAANAISGGVNNAASWYALNNMAKPTGTVSPGAE